MCYKKIKKKENDINETLRTFTSINKNSVFFKAKTFDFSFWIFS
jgi:hypothetical protein